MSKKKTTTKVTTEVTIEDAKNEKTEIVCILDRSGSMGSIINDAIGGFNTFIEEQKKEDTPATITVALFDDQYELLHDNVDIKQIEEITKSQWSPRGLTSLYDAVGKTINTVKARHKSLEKSERPDKVLVCIVTDGDENSSQEYNSDTVKELIKKREKKNWSFVFLAADQDAMTAGGAFGVGAGNAFNYSNTAKGNKHMFASMSKMSSNVRGMSVNDVSYADMSMNLAANLEEDKEE